MNTQLQTNTSELSLLLSKLTESQVITNSALSNVTQRVETLEEKFEKDVFVTNAQRVSIKTHVKSRVRDFCVSFSYSYDTYAKILFSALYSDLNTRFCVTSYNELPRAYYKEIIEIIKDWIPTEHTLKRINK